MRISIITLFPELFSGPFSHSILKRAKEKGILDITFIQLRDFADDTYRTVDDHPYGGGVGMILKVDVLDRALQAARRMSTGTQHTTILLDPQGSPYTQSKAKSLSVLDHIILVCGHYEGIDERVRSLVDEEISIGDYVLTGGEIPAMVLVDSVTRLIPGVLSKPDATIHESFEQSSLEYPQYTRPETYKDMTVPIILRSGNHAEIEKWRLEQARIKTAQRRPDLISAASTPTSRAKRGSL